MLDRKIVLRTILGHVRSAPSAPAVTNANGRLFRRLRLSVRYTLSIHRCPPLTISQVWLTMRRHCRGLRGSRLAATSGESCSAATGSESKQFPCNYDRGHGHPVHDDDPFSGHIGFTQSSRTSSRPVGRNKRPVVVAWNAQAMQF